ncbi:MAG: hypothetical protein GF353_26885 [Candidatus Lokiarchaeota archaeon]|nr:hypothetical protein [Candidatus Lokiarchaeota archaeon]
MVKTENQRYIIFDIITEDLNRLNKSKILNSIWNSIWRYFGMNEACKIGLWIIDLDLNKNFGLLRCTDKTKEIVITSLTMIKEIENKKIILSPVKTSGTLKSIRKYIKERFNRNPILRRER